MDNSGIIQRFYTAFSNHDAAGMAQCYHPEVEFCDPAFGILKGAQVNSMWEMLISRSNGNLKVSVANIASDADTGSADWTAEYLFSKTGRKVVNRVNAKFRFKDGLIIYHLDNFDFWKWSQQALGVTGFLFGWTPFLRNKVRKQARAALEKYSASN